MLDYQPRPYRRTWRQRRRIARQWIANLKTRDGAPIWPIVLIAIGTFSGLLFIDSLRHGPMWLTVLTVVPTLGLVGFVLSFGVIFLALLDEANGWSRRWKARREIEMLRRRTSRFWNRRSLR